MFTEHTWEGSDGRAGQREGSVPLTVCMLMASVDLPCSGEMNAICMMSYVFNIQLSPWWSYSKLVFDNIIFLRKTTFRKTTFSSLLIKVYCSRSILYNSCFTILSRYGLCSGSHPLQLCNPVVMQSVCGAGQPLPQFIFRICPSFPVMGSCPCAL